MVGQCEKCKQTRDGNEFRFYYARPWGSSIQEKIIGHVVTRRYVYGGSHTSFLCTRCQVEDNNAHLPSLRAIKSDLLVVAVLLVSSPVFFGLFWLAQAAASHVQDPALTIPYAICFILIIFSGGSLLFGLRYLPESVFPLIRYLVKRNKSYRRNPEAGDRLAIKINEHASQFTDHGWTTFFTRREYAKRK
jgi:hypothetical protein